MKEELPYENTYSAGWIDHPSYDLYIPARQHGQAPHYWNNYKDGKRSVFIAEYGDWEYYAHNAGFNQTQFADLTEEERTSRQLRAYGEQRLLQQAMNYQEATNSNRKGVATIGHSNWLMFDYNRGYAEDLESSGISDIFRIPKFSYFFYKSQRPPNDLINHPLVDSGPMVKIASYWTNESPLKIKVFSNCNQVALYLNDRFIGIESPTINEFSNYLKHPPFEFNLKEFKPGTLKAVGLINGEEKAIDLVSTPRKPTKIIVKIDNEEKIAVEKNDIFFIYAEIVDLNGTIVSNAFNLVTFNLNGSGELVGENPVKAEAGIATILFRGDITQAKITATTTTNLMVKN